MPCSSSGGHKRQSLTLRYPENNAVRAEQILNETVKNYPDSHTAEAAKVLRDLIASNKLIVRLVESGRILACSGTARSCVIDDTKN